MKNPCGSTVRRYSAPIIDLNKYLAVFPRAKTSDKMFETELNEILLNSVPNRWSSQAYVQRFDFESTTLKEM